jgi:DNA polymerase-3 subunit gamma/tau
MGTRALLQQQGHLINYDGKAARVGIRSDKLLKMAQSKLPNIEAAFQQLLNQPVKVSLEVAGAPPAEIPPPTTAPPPPPAQRDRPSVAPPTPSPTAAPDSTTAAAPDPPASPAPPHAITRPDTPVAHQWQSASDVDRAVKSFAEFFNGQIVDLSDDDEESAAADPGKPGKGRAKPSSSPGHDVPF